MRNGIRVSAIYGAMDLAPILRRGIGAAAANTTRIYARPPDRIDDRSPPLLTRDNVARRNPASNTFRFQGGADSVGLWLVVV